LDAIFQDRADMLLADGAGTCVQMIVNIADEGQPFFGAGEGRIGDKKKRLRCETTTPSCSTNMRGISLV
jgi:hypothetical protein